MEKEKSTMKKVILYLAAVWMMTAPLAAMAAMEHDHGAMKMDNDHAAIMEKGKAAYEESVDGVKVKFTFHDIRNKDASDGHEGDAPCHGDVHRCRLRETVK